MGTHSANSPCKNSLSSKELQLLRYIWLNRSCKIEIGEHIIYNLNKYIQEISGISMTDLKSHQHVNWPHSEKAREVVPLKYFDYLILLIATAKVGINK